MCEVVQAQSRNEFRSVLWYSEFQNYSEFRCNIPLVSRPVFERNYICTVVFDVRPLLPLVFASFFPVCSRFDQDFVRRAFATTRNWSFWENIQFQQQTTGKSRNDGASSVFRPSLFLIVFPPPTPPHSESSGPKIEEVSKWWGKVSRTSSTQLIHY